jgi:inner membrane protein
MSIFEDLSNPSPGAPQVPENAPPRPGGFATFMRSPGVKFIIIGILSMLLLIPTLLVWTLVDERSDRANQVSATIANGWGGQQVLNGPYLAVPFSVNRSQTNQNGTVTWTKVTEWALVMPEMLDIGAKLQAEARKLSIYSLPVYNAKMALKGRFGKDIAASLAQVEGTPDLDRAFLVMNIADITGIRSNADIRIDDAQPVPFEPGMRGITAYKPNFEGTYYDSQSVSDTGINRPVGRDLLEKGFDFSMELSLNGSGRFSVAPAGQTTKLTVAANWADPGFEGTFLPDTKTITDRDFSAGWTIPYLARGLDKVVSGTSMPLSNALMSVNLVEPVKFYQMISRTLKYSIGFISLMFFAVFIIELKSARLVHWVQYVLSGLALIIFYIMLLAFAEHIGFGPAYAIAATLTTVLIALYVGAATTRQSGVALAVVLGVTYGIMYLILREDEYALLAGAIVSFLTIAATMYFTRNIDWSGSRVATAQ